MMVSWNTPAKVVNPTVHWGMSAGSLNETASSQDSTTYHTSTTYNNHVKITGLQPDTKYHYMPAGTNLSEPLSFRTSRPTGDHTPFVAAVIVDMGTFGKLGLTTHVGNGSANPLKDGEKNTIASLRDTQNDWDFVWHGEFHV